MLHKPDLKENLFFLFSGMVISVPFPFLVENVTAYFFSTRLPPTIADIILVALIAPVFEEFAKAYPLFYRHSETERSLFKMGLLTGLGFGIAEMLFYVIGAGVPILARLPALIFHATNTSIVGYGVAKKKDFAFYSIAVGLHFLNNISAMFGMAWVFIGIPATLASYFLSIYLYNKTTERVKSF